MKIGKYFSVMPLLGYFCLSLLVIQQVLSDACEHPYYGFECNKTCSKYCAGNKTCDHRNGTCNQGCEAGYEGPQCLIFTTEENGKSDAPNMSVIVGTILMAFILYSALFCCLVRDYKRNKRKEARAWCLQELRKQTQLDASGSHWTMNTTSISPLVSSLDVYDPTVHGDTESGADDDDSVQDFKSGTYDDSNISLYVNFPKLDGKFLEESVHSDA